MNMTTSEAIRNLENSLVCVKAMVFERAFPNGHVAYATVLCCVPNEAYGKVKIGCLGGKPYPESSGTFIRAIGFGLMSPAKPIPLTCYERYLEKEGWKFLTTVKSARRQTPNEAFSTCRSTIEVIKSLRDKI